MMKLDTGLNDCYVIESKIFKDSRGYFFESHNERNLNNLLNRQLHFVQDNQSKSTRGVLRGMHYQMKHAQGKLVRVVHGEVFDVAVDLRKSSATFGRWFGITLSEDNQKQLWVPEGFAHGFLVLSAEAIFCYKTTDYYHPEYEVCLRWNDSDLGIDWPKTEGPYLKEKDANGFSFKDCPKYV